jgi:hypothetical protein
MGPSPGTKAIRTEPPAKPMPPPSNAPIAPPIPGCSDASCGAACISSTIFALLPGVSKVIRPSGNPEFRKSLKVFSASACVLKTPVIASNVAPPFVVFNIRIC